MSRRRVQWMPAPTLAAHSTTYDRFRDLPRLLRLWPEDVRRLREADQCWLVDRLAQMLRGERQRGINRHWSYDLTRHAALLRAWRAEKEALKTHSVSVNRPLPSSRSMAVRTRTRLSLPGDAARAAPAAPNT